METLYKYRLHSDMEFAISNQTPDTAFYILFLMRKITTKDSEAEDHQASFTTNGEAVAIDIESPKSTCCTSVSITFA
jgi:hypothetical protein